MTYAAKLRKALDESGMRQGELAKAAGVSATQMSMYLGGHSEPRPEAALRIAAALGIAHDRRCTMPRRSCAIVPTATCR